MNPGTTDKADYKMSEMDKCESVLEKLSDDTVASHTNSVKTRCGHIPE